MSDTDRAPKKKRWGEISRTEEAAGLTPSLAVRLRTGPVYHQARRLLGVGLALLIVGLFLALTQPAFATMTNLSNVLRSVAVLYMVAMGNTFVLLTAGFDLSVGSMLALAGVALATLLTLGVAPGAAVLLVLLLGLALGALTNGMLVGRLGLSFFVVTLATMSLFRGLVNVHTGGSTTHVSEPLIQFLGNGRIFGFSVPILLMLGTLVLSIFVLHFTRYGRAVYAVGGNREAARLAGINVSAVLVSVYAISGLFAALAGIIQVGRLGAAAPIAGTGIELSAAAAVLLGGTSFSGGSGGVIGTAIGVLFIGVLRNGLGLMGVSAFWQDVVTGIVLIIAITIDRFSRARDS